MSTFVENVWFRTLTCGECGTLFAMTQRLYDQRLRDRKSFYCPLGHPRQFIGQTEEQKLRDELERVRQMRDAESARAGRLQAERDQVAKAHKRMRTRVMNGVCPCCNRTFQNLLRHMRTEHEGELTLRAFREAFGMTQHALADEIGISATYVSLAERGKHIPERAQGAVDSWMARQGAQEARR